jgi:hypothetical protein
MPTSQFVDAVFYVQKDPSVRIEDGLFHVCYDTGKIHAEFVMRPTVFLKALKAANRLSDEFHESSARVVPLKRKR